MENLIFLIFKMCIYLCKRMYSCPVAVLSKMGLPREDYWHLKPIILSIYDMINVCYSDSPIKYQFSQFCDISWVCRFFKLHHLFENSVSSPTHRLQVVENSTSSSNKPLNTKKSSKSTIIYTVMVLYNDKFTITFSSVMQDMMIYIYYLT